MNEIKQLRQVALTGYAHGKGVFVYNANWTRSNEHAIADALAYAAGYPVEFPGEVTATILEG